MMVAQTRRQVRAREAGGLVDLTHGVASTVAASGIVRGRVELFSPARAARIIVNERESGLLLDIKNAIERARDSAHDYDVGTSWVAVPVAEGRLQLGTWQRVMVLESEEPQARELIVNVLGE